MAATDAKKSSRCAQASAGSPRRPVGSSTSARSTSPSTPPRATPSARSFGSGSMRSSTARRSSPSTTSCSAPSWTCLPSAALVTTSSSSTR
eukprot:1266071-Pleurochrysis_carterae.AAC.1